MRRTILFPVLAVLLLASSAGLGAQEVITVGDTSASLRALGNGNTELTFTAVLGLNVIPITFNFHWERSDGAKTAVKVVSVRNPGEQTYRLVEKWVVKQTVPVDQLWEKVYVNSGNTHLVSSQIMASGAGEAVAVAPAQAPAPAGAHPAYLHALSDLRLARALLMGWVNPIMMIQLHDAGGQIEAAIRDITDAAISDGKSIDDHPPIDAALDNRGRLVQAHELLNKAYKDIDERETNAADLALRSKALGHISKARQDLADARRLANWL